MNWCAPKDNLGRKVPVYARCRSKLEELCKIYALIESTKTYNEGHLMAVGKNFPHLGILITQLS